MTEHSEPRRWTLKQDSNWAPPLLTADGPLLSTEHKIGESVIAETAVREDTATEADVEAVAKALSGCHGTKQGLSAALSVCGKVAEIGVA